MAKSRSGRTNTIVRDLTETLVSELNCDRSVNKEKIKTKNKANSNKSPSSISCEYCRSTTGLESLVVGDGTTLKKSITKTQDSTLTTKSKQLKSTEVDLST